jgi:salicylate hydroxylase
MRRIQCHPLKVKVGDYRIIDLSAYRYFAHPLCHFHQRRKIGANQALLDALSLARCLYATSSTNNKDVVVDLKNFHSEMVDRSAKKVQASAQAAQFLHTSVAIQEGNVTRGAAASTSEQEGKNKILHE